MVFSPVQVISAKLKLSFIAFIFPRLWLKREREKEKKKKAKCVLYRGLKWSRVCEPQGRAVSGDAEIKSQPLKSTLTNNCRRVSNPSEARNQQHQTRK